MPSVDREESRDRELVLKHQSSLSESGRASVPMWDSSDPDRAPPPLPLNPGSASPATKPNTSATITAAAEALTAKARESAYTTNPLPNRSPEKSLIKGQYHKRMQSLQNGHGNVRDRNTFLDGTSSLERSLERIPRTPGFDFENRSPEKSPTRTGTPTPSVKDVTRDTPVLRPASRPPPRAILGENTPPSSTMLALQHAPAPKDTDTSLSNITNNSSALTRSPQSFEAISSQILSLTSIATNLQREMAQLSRRSKDNATDLISLKEATHSRDEDIRTSLRDLVNNLSSQLIEPGADNSSRSTSHYSRGTGPYLLESKAHGSPSGIPKSYSLPRIPSPNSFVGLDREIVASPYNMEGAASIALLEKILREMGTKEGQERLLSSLSELRMKDSDPAVAKKLEEILTFLKESNNRNVVMPRTDNGNGVGDRPLKLELEYDSRSMSLARISRETTPRSGQDLSVEARTLQTTPGAAAGFVSDDIIKSLKKMKDSVTEGGGMTAELKALVRELRGEVLGMGREIGRKLDQAESAQSQHNMKGDAGREEITKIVEHGLFELKGQIENVMREIRRQSSVSAMSRSTEDIQELYIAVKNALNEFPFDQRIALQNPGSGIERDEILEAIHEAWEDYKPTIDVTTTGMDHDETLACLEQGLKEYQLKVGASYQEVLQAVHEGLKHFNPPAPIVSTEANITKEEMLMAVRECLDTFEFPTSSIGEPRELEMIREDVLDAVKEGFSAQGQTSKEVEISRENIFEAVRAGVKEGFSAHGKISKDLEFSREDMYEAVKAGVEEGFSIQGNMSKEVGFGRDDMLAAVRAGVEEGLCAHGKIPKDLEFSREDMYEAVKAGIEEGFSVQGQSSKDLEFTREDMYEAVKAGVEEGFTAQGQISKEVGSSRDDIFETVRAALEDAHNSTNSVGEQVLEKMQDLLDGMRIEFKQYSTANGGDTEQVLDAMKDGLEALRENVSSNTGEVLDALNDGLDGLRTDVERMVNKPVDMTVNYEILDTLKEGLANVRADVDRLHSAEEDLTAGKGGEVVIADPEAREKANAATEFGMGSASKENMAIMEALLKEVCASVEEIREKMMADDIGDRVRKSDIEALETLCMNTKTHIEDLVLPEVDNLPTKSEIEDSLDTFRADVERIVNKPLVLPEVDNLPTKSEIEDSLDTLRADVERIVNKPLDMTVNYEILDTLKEGLANIRADVDRLRSAEQEILGSKGSEVVIADGDARRDIDTVDEFGMGTASKEDLSNLEALLREVFASVEGIHDKMMAEDIGNRVQKSDIAALETLCMDTKTQIEELPLPDAETLPTKSEIEALNDLVKSFVERREQDAELTARAFESRKIEHGGLADKIEDVKLFLEDVRAELKAKLEDDGHTIQELSKTLETFAETVVGTDAIPLVNELKDVVTREFESIQGIFAGSELEHEQKHNSLLERHDEHKTAIVSELHSKIDERFDEIMTKYDDAQIAAEQKERTLQETTLQQTDTLNTTKSVVQDLRMLMDTLGSTITESCDRMGEDSKTVFGRIEDVGSKINDLLSQDQKNEHQSTREEISKTLTGVEGVLQSRIDERFDEIMTKHDDAQIAAEEKEKSFRDTTLQQTDALNTTTRSVAEDIRSFVDTLGSTITNSCDRIGEDSEKVFEHIESIGSKIDGLLSIDHTSEHQSTRAEISKTLTGIEGVQVHVTEYQPKILEAIKEVLNIVGQHYEQSKTSTEEIKTSVQAIPAAIPLPAIAPPSPPPPMPIEFPVHESYDNSAINAKLDQLIGRAEEAEKSQARFASLEEIREHVTAMASEFSEFVAGQQTAIARAANDRAREAEGIAVALQMRISQKDLVEAEITRMLVQKDELSKSVETLIREKEDLIHDREDLIAQKSKIQVDLSSLKTALEIRREELHVLEERADTVERGILDGIMDHSRSLLTTSRRPPSSLKDMNLKRVVSTTSNTTTCTRASPNSPTVPSSVTSAVSSGIGMALKRRQPKAPGSSTANSRGDRRILSLSTLGGNKGVNVERSLVLANSPRIDNAAKGSAFGVGGLKRSHSVKTNFPVRKTSWGGTKALGMYADEGTNEEEDKENSVLDEEDEDAEGSDAGTERRTSYSGTYTDMMSYGDGSVISADDRRTSYAPSTVGTTGTKDYATTEDGDGESETDSTDRGEEDDHEQNDAGVMTVFGQGRDTGIGASAGGEI